MIHLIKIAIVYYGLPAKIVSRETLRANYRYLMFFCQSEHLAAFKDQRLSGSDRKARRTSIDHGLYRRNSNNGDIKTHVLIGLRDLNDGQLPVCQLTGTTDRGVSSLHRLDRDTRLATDNDRLAKVEPRDLARDVQAVFDIAKLDVSRLSLCEYASRSKMIFYEMRRINQFNSLFRHLVCNATDKSIGIPTRQIPQHLDHSQIRQCSREDLHVLDLPCHDSLLDTVILEERYHLPKLPNANPRDILRNLLDLWIRFLLDRAHRKLNPPTPGAFARRGRRT